MKLFKFDKIKKIVRRNRDTYDVVLSLSLVFILYIIFALIVASVH